MEFPQRGPSTILVWETFQRRWSFNLAELRFLGYLAEVAGARTRNLFLERPKPLREILPSPFPEENIVILIDEKVGNLDSLVNNESSIVIMPVLSGG